MIIKSLEEWKKLASLVSSTQAEYVRDGFSQSLARIKAGEDVASTCDEPTTREELESALAVFRNTNFEKPESDVNDASTVQIYRAWAMNNDRVTKDAELAHFTGNTPGSYGAARSLLSRKYGFVFTKDAYGWSIVAPEPDEEKLYTESDMKKAIEDFMKKFGK